MQNPLPYDKEETLEEATSINMDRLTQLQDGIDEVRVEYLNRAQVHVDQDQVKFRESQRELVQDIVKKSKQIELLIENLPGMQNSEQEQIDMIKELNKEMHEANLEYLKAVEDAESLKKQIMETIGILCRDQSTAYNTEE
ncbi:18017_t:CDS:2 [Funneliformis geosporum]|uniref:Mediator of RNA polymerase II transcription subunit 21 n=1 Tax=Funneliformis geosporum TaxID=1117311 RepID=A0A9W4WVV2_9GLOM|nr:18017_t:CDS:2 [Funneliformis geosporum]